MGTVKKLKYIKVHAIELPGEIFDGGLAFHCSTWRDTVSHFKEI